MLLFSWPIQLLMSFCLLLHPRHVLFVLFLSNANNSFPQNFRQINIFWQQVIIHTSLVKRLKELCFLMILLCFCFSAVSLYQGSIDRKVALSFPLKHFQSYRLIIFRWIFFVGNIYCRMGFFFWFSFRPIDRYQLSTNC